MNISNNSTTCVALDSGMAAWFSTGCRGGPKQSTEPDYEVLNPSALVLTRGQSQQANSQLVVQASTILLTTEILHDPIHAMLS